MHVHRAKSCTNNAVPGGGKRALIDDNRRFDGVTVIGVAEHAWHRTRLGAKYPTVIIDLTSGREGTTAARLLDMIERRTNQAFRTLFADSDQTWRGALNVVAAETCSSSKTAAAEDAPAAVAVRDPVRPVRLADALDRCRHRAQLAIHGR